MNGRNGQVRRTLVIPTNPRTASQMTVRAKLSIVAKHRRTLTENQRQAWNSADNTYSSTAPLGQSGPLGPGAGKGTAAFNCYHGSDSTLNAYACLQGRTAAS
jgi:hypothetical protein